jgi:adenylosuccinate synthase
MQQDFPNVGKNVVVDINAFTIKQEYIEEDKLTGIKQGTTFRGIKQAYRAKVERAGVRVYHLINDNAPIIQKLKDQGVQFIPLLALQETMQKSNLLFEGNQGVMLSLDQGLYPYVTSSDTTVTGIYSSGFHWVKLDRVFGVAKGGYVTRSGGRRLPTEMPDKEASEIVEKANEKGNTTGRNRGIGYFDCVALKYACMAGGITHLILTKLDISDNQPSIKVCSSYGKEVYSPNDFDNITPHYIDLPGWKDSKNSEQTLPFIKYIESFVGIPVEYISTGTSTKDLLSLKKKII